MTSADALRLFGPLVFDLVKAAIWPVVVLCVLGAFRPQFSSLLGRVSESDWWGVKTKFAPPQQQSYDEVKKLAERVEPTLGKKPKTYLVSTDKTPPPRGYGPSSNAASTNPRSQVPRGTGPWFQGLEERIKNDPRLKDLPVGEQLDVVIGAQAVAQSIAEFERIFRIIFGSQLRAVRLADQSGGAVPRDEVIAIFDAASERFPDTHKDKTFDQWFQFLVAANLLVELPQADGKRMVGVTDFGHEFLVYITQMRYPEPSA